MSIRKIDAELIYYFIQRLQEEGISCDVWLEGAGLKDAIAREEKWIPLSAWDRFVELCSQAPLPRPFSLTAASWIIDFDTLNQLEGDKRKMAFIYLLSSASTITELLEQIDRFHSVLTIPTKPKLVQGETYVAVYDDTMEECGLSVTTCELIFATWLTYIRKAWADKHQLVDHLSVHFKHDPPQQLADYVEVFGSQLTFNNKHNEIRFPWEFGDHVFVGSDSNLYKLMIQNIEAVFKEQQPMVEGIGGFSSSCATLIREGLPDELLTIDQLAKHFHMSVSTLSRRLREEDYNYRKLVDEVRQQLAYEYMNQPKVVLDELVNRLGFYDYSAMNKAFQRWFSQTPIEFYRS